MRRRFVLLAAVLAVVLFGSVSAAYARPNVTAKGQAYTAAKLKKSIKLPNGKRSSMTFTIKKSSGTKVKGYAVSSTVYYERGPNDDGYHRVSRGQAYTVFKNWGGGGNCPAKLVYKKYVKAGKTYRVLSKVYYFMNGE